MADTPLPKKLLIKPGNTVLLIDAPKSYTITDLPQGAKIVTHTPADVALAFVKNKAQLDAFIFEAKVPVVPDGRFWICYPKKTGSIKTDIHRDVVYPAMTAAGWEGAGLISLDDTWSAMRFRPPGAKK